MKITFIIVALLFVSLGLFDVVYAQTVYFSADAETGDLSQWDYGGTAPGAIATYQTNSASAEVVHSGNFAFKHDLPDPNNDTVDGHNAKFVNWQIDQHTAYYSAWYNVADGFTDSTWKNIMQWKGDIPGGAGGVVFAIHLLNINGVRQLTLRHTGCILSSESTCINFSQYPQWQTGWYTQQNPIPIPDDTWFHIETYYKSAKTNGQIIVWQDGVEIFNLSDPNLNTLNSKVNDNKYVYWGIGNYISPDSPGPHLLYTDGALVTDYRVGADNGGELAGDLNADGAVNMLDWNIMLSKWWTSDAVADLNNDGIVNTLDFSILNSSWTN